MVSSTTSLTHLRWRRRFRSLAALVLIAALAFAAWMWSPTPAVTMAPVHVIDGDSLTVLRDDARLTIRLTGIDAVEYRQNCTRAGAVWPCGRDARTMLEKLVGRGQLHCELAARDHYGRTLAACRTAAFPDGIELGAEMVRLGWAVSSDGAYVAEETEAQAGRRGIWQGGFAEPADWRAAHERPASATPPPDT